MKGVLKLIDVLCDAITGKIPKGESPIEDVLIFALHRDLGYIPRCEPFTEENLKNLWISAGGKASAFIFSQHKIPPYRVDILLIAFGEDGEYRKLIIECDGREFHSSPKQKEHDDRRARFVKIQGYHLIRYSGYQINRDINGVMSDIVSALGIIGTQIARGTGKYPRPGHWHPDENYPEFGDDIYA